MHAGARVAVSAALVALLHVVLLAQPAGGRSGKQSVANFPPGRLPRAPPPKQSLTPPPKPKVDRPPPRRPPPRRKPSHRRPPPRRPPPRRRPPPKDPSRRRPPPGSRAPPPRVRSNSRTVYYNPVGINNVPLAFCFFYYNFPPSGNQDAYSVRAGARCGAYTADMFCRTRGHAGASGWGKGPEWPIDGYELLTRRLLLPDIGADTLGAPPDDFCSPSYPCNVYLPDVSFSYIECAGQYDETNQVNIFYQPTFRLPNSTRALPIAWCLNGPTVDCDDNINACDIRNETQCDGISVAHLYCKLLGFERAYDALLARPQQVLADDVSPKLYNAVYLRNGVRGFTERVALAILCQGIITYAPPLINVPLLPPMPPPGPSWPSLPPPPRSPPPSPKLPPVTRKSSIKVFVTGGGTGTSGQLRFTWPPNSTTQAVVAACGATGNRVARLACRQAGLPFQGAYLSKVYQPRAWTEGDVVWRPGRTSSSTGPNAEPLMVVQSIYCPADAQLLDECTITPYPARSGSPSSGSSIFWPSGSWPSATLEADSEPEPIVTCLTPAVSEYTYTQYYADYDYKPDYDRGLQPDGEVVGVVCTSGARQRPPSPLQPVLPPLPPHPPRPPPRTPAEPTPAPVSQFCTRPGEALGLSVGDIAPSTPATYSRACTAPGAFIRTISRFEASFKVTSLMDELQYNFTCSDGTALLPMPPKPLPVPNRADRVTSQDRATTGFVAASFGDGTTLGAYIGRVVFFNSAVGRSRTRLCPGAQQVVSQVEAWTAMWAGYDRFVGYRFCCITKA